MDSKDEIREKSQKWKEEYPIPEYEKRKITEAINRSDTEKFQLFCRLMQVHFLLKSAEIVK